MNDGIVKIILALIGLLGTIITYVAVPYIKSKTTKEQRENLTYWAEIAVKGIEEYYKDQPKKGEIKKVFVLDFMKSQGFDISTDQLNVLIDAIVKEMNKTHNEFKE